MYNSVMQKMNFSTLLSQWFLGDVYPQKKITYKNKFDAHSTTARLVIVFDILRKSLLTYPRALNNKVLTENYNTQYPHIIDARWVQCRPQQSWTAESPWPSTQQRPSALWPPGMSWIFFVSVPVLRMFLWDGRKYKQQYIRGLHSQVKPEYTRLHFQSGYMWVWGVEVEICLATEDSSSSLVNYCVALKACHFVTVGVCGEVQTHTCP